MAIVVDLNGAGAGSGTTGSYTENQGDLILFGSATIVSSGNSVPDTVKAILSNPSSAESLAATFLPAGYTASYAAGVLTINSGSGVISDANWQAVLQSIVYNNTSNAPLITRTVKVSAADTLGGQTSSSTAVTDTITITVVNDAPVIAGDLSANVSSGGTYVLTTADLGEADPDDSSAGLTYTVDALLNGVVRVNGNVESSFTAKDVVDGKVSFVHDGSITTDAGFEFTLADGGEDGVVPVSGTFSFVVNNAPTGNATATLTDGTEDVDYTVNAADLLQGFTDSNGDTLSISAMTADRGSATDNLDGTWTIHHAFNYSGVVNLIYTVSDGRGGSIAAQQSYALTPANDAPVVVAPLVAQAVQYNTLGWNYTVSAAFSDIDAGDALSFGATLANGDALPAWMQVDADTGVISGSPLFGDLGTYALSVIATDALGDSVSAPLTVAVTVFDAGQLLVSTGGNDVLAGTLPANDTVTYAFAAAPVTVSAAIAVQQNTLGAGLDTLTNIDNLIGSGFADALTGNVRNNVLDGGAGIDTLKGGAGNDTYIVDNTGDIVTETLTGGTDLVMSTATYTLKANAENLTLLGSAAINGTGNALANIITGNSGNNVLNGAAGADTLIGGQGNDTYTVDHSGDIVTEQSNAGTDKINSAVDYTLPVEVENLTLTGAVAIIANGNDLANVLTGNALDNHLNGGIGNDTLTGGAGNDTLDGGTGNNKLTGGAGADLFRLTTAGHSDTIADFAVIDDTIEISSTVFTSLTAGVLAADQFVIGAAAADANDFIIYNKNNGALLYDADGNDPTIAAVQIAKLGINLAMTNADIVVI